MDYTNEQKQAIFHDKGDILVSASAGSGKTFVMIQRLINLILEKNVSVNEVLAVTFTKLAAGEMKEKLIDALTQKINSPDISEKDVERLKEEIADAPTASISTFHSFCNDLIKNYFYELGLDASFKIADDAQSEMLNQKALDIVFERKYLEADEDFNHLLSVFMKKRSDRQLRKIVLNTFKTYQSEAYPEKAILSAVSIYSKEGLEKVKTAFFEYYRGFFNDIKNDFSNIREDFLACEMKKQVEDVDVLSALCDEIIGSNSILAMAEKCRGMKHTLSSIKPNDDEYLEELKENISTLKERMFDEIKYIRENFDGVTEEEIEKNFLSAGVTARALARLCLEFGKVFAELKREDNLVDYSDLEHFTLQLLDKKDIQEAVSNTYKYIFADEYQDTNGVQEEILSRIGRNNIFMVGDVKQCIYAFRGCNPGIFEDKLKRFEKGEEKAVYLSANFRSSTAVLNTVNSTFSEIMTEDTCGIDYAKNAMCGGNGKPGLSEMRYVKIAGKTKQAKEKQEKPEIYKNRGVYSVKDNIEGEFDEEIFNEGVLIADLIREVLDTPDVNADGEKRVYEYKDVVILTRSLKGYARRLSEAIARCDIPVSSENEKDVSVYPETRGLIALLKLIDCARQDVPLCAVMRGPIGNFSDMELAEIRAFSMKHGEGKKGRDERSFYEATRFYVDKNEDELSKKITEFFEYVDKLRFLAEFEGAGSILARVVREKKLDLYYMATADGESRLKRINKLVQEADGGETPYSVKDFLLRLEADDVSVTEAGGENAVRIMSIHASKGLEFPIVIVCGMDRKNNESEIAEEVICDREYGISVKTYDTIKMNVCSNILRDFLKKRFRSQFIKEEMRILYVAMTRAKNRLYLTQTATNLPRRVSISDIKSANKSGALVATKGKTVKSFTPEELKVKLVEKRQNNVIGASKNDALEERIAQSIAFVYPHDVAVASKNSVTAVLKEEGDVTPELFVEHDDNSSIERGNAFHRFMELVDFNKPSLSQVIEQKQSFLQSGAMTEEECKLVDEEKITAVLDSKIFKEEDATYYRELPFEALVPMSVIRDGGGEDEVLIQGVIDLIAFTKDGIKIIDYKVSGKNKQTLVRDYKKQLDLYAYATERITGEKVVSKCLVNLLKGWVVEV